MSNEPQSGSDIGLTRLSAPELQALQTAITSLSDLSAALGSGDLILSRRSSAGQATAPAVPPDSPRLIFARNPLETLDALATRLQRLISANGQLAGELRPMADELSGLRQDMAEMFYELKMGNIAVAAALAEESYAADRSRKRTDTRLDQLEDRD